MVTCRWVWVSAESLLLRCGRSTRSAQRTVGSRARPCGARVPLPAPERQAHRDVGLFFKRFSL